ncbi:MAG TPA: dihydrofolate reductase family protein [Mucilaginibacter sp.]|jgi:dihydrofolate reductase|nr:dihydrofolate reductase family protein [Mucilaginibacter sp.]
MRKIIVSNLVSVDGFICGPNGEFDWQVVNDEFFAYAEEMLNEMDGLIFGRKTYEMMASFWPTAEAKKNDPVIANKMNSLQKIVFSRTLNNAGWENSILIRDNMKENVLKLKQQPGKDMVIFGSGEIVSAFTQMGVIDEYRFIINPIILGAGKSQFEGLPERKKLELTDIKRFNTGVVILYYQPIS